MGRFLASFRPVSTLLLSLLLGQTISLMDQSYASAADEAGSTIAKGTAEATTASEKNSNDPAVKEVATAHKEKPLLQRGDLPNFHEVYPYLYRGGEPTEAGMTQLKEKGVGTIIDLRAKTEQEIAEARIAKDMGFKYINLPMTSAAPTDAQIKTVLGAIDEAKKKNASGDKQAAVFVHCAHGSDRTGCMIGIWRVTRDGWDYPTAYKEMRKYYFTPKFVNLSGAVEKAAEHH